MKTRRSAFRFSLALAGVSLGLLSAIAVEIPESRELMLAARNSWPTLFELDPGQSVTLRTTDSATTVKLLAVQHRTEPDYWTGKSRDHAIISCALVTVEVNGRREVLLCRPYEMPRTLGSIRLYVETTKGWADTPQLAPITGVKRAVRFSAVAAGSSWGPATLAFPIRDYRWRSSTYENTWGSLVPFNVLYYHRGEDLGAIPDRLTLVAILPGLIVASPLPNGDGQSNGLIINPGSDASFRYAHMNVEHVNPAATVGAQVERGQPVGRTGCTWSGRRSQHNDPHVHLGLKLNDTEVSFFPSLVEAYFRDYDDALLPLAGGFGFVMAGDDYVLDGSRSLARPGRKIVSHRWRLHDGREVDGVRQTVSYERPGFFAEELIVRADDGSEERDAIHVRVYEPQDSRNIVVGWLHYAPARAIRPGTTVTFWNRLSKTDGAARIDFGDGSEPQAIKQELTHAYRQPGLYTVALSARGVTGDSALLKVRLRVEAAPRAKLP